MNGDDNVDEDEKMHSILGDLYHDFNHVGSFGHDKQEREPNNKVNICFRLLKDS